MDVCIPETGNDGEFGGVDVRSVRRSTVWRDAPDPIVDYFDRDVFPNVWPRGVPHPPGKDNGPPRGLLRTVCEIDGYLLCLGSIASDLLQPTIIQI